LINQADVGVPWEKGFSNVRFGAEMGDDWSWALVVGWWMRTVRVLLGFSGMGQSLSGRVGASALGPHRAEPSHLLTGDLRHGQDR
jgi:hypothetical protein